MRNSLIIKSKLSDYHINFIDSLNDIIQIVNQPNTILIIDKNVSMLYPTITSDNILVIESTEQAKTLDNCSYVLDHLTSQRANVLTKIVAVGGGVIQDLVGFCASIYCRGIEYILIPTTLLAQVDSCIGGKTSINYGNRKNILGTFYPPSNILIYSGFLNSLSKLDYISGLGEVYKFHILQGNINSFDPYGPINDMIYNGLEYKSNILLLDEFDKKERKYLNYGHTFGHALESISNHKIPHGIAVIIGCLIATNISVDLGYEVNDYDTILNTAISLLRDSKIKLEKEWFDSEVLLDIIKSDKKNIGNLVMVLVKENQPRLEIIENTTIIYNILNNTYESIRLRN